MTLADNVARGAAWLDTVAPDWADRVDLSTLDLRSSTHCVAGQALAPGEEGSGNGYGRMLDLLGYRIGDVAPDVAYGFTHPDRHTETSLYAPDRTDSDPRLEELRALWTAQITIRRQSPETVVRNGFTVADLAQIRATATEDQGEVTG
jgi:hypothetical protein